MRRFRGPSITAGPGAPLGAGTSPSASRADPLLNSKGGVEDAEETRAAASARFLTLRISIARWTWVSTVLGAIPSVAAICFVVCRRATSRRHCLCLSLRSSTRFPTMVECNAARTAHCLHGGSASFHQRSDRTGGRSVPSFVPSRKLAACPRIDRRHEILRVTPHCGELPAIATGDIRRRRARRISRRTIRLWRRGRGPPAASERTSHPCRRTWSHSGSSHARPARAVWVPI